MISASLVKDLREKTGAGMLDCKKALEATNGDFNAAVDWLREKGISTANKKASRIAAEGMTDILIEGNKAVIVEVNSETDFVAKNPEFKELVKEILTVLLNNNALITDDESIYCSAQKNAIDSILINKSSVKLKGRDYGFIGGTCGMIGKNLLAFTGNLDTHIDAELIKSFLKKHSVDYIELNDGPLIDIGGIIPFSEYI